MSNNIDTLSIEGLQGKQFLIPDYQRGYRWTTKQVIDLLEDIHAFTPSDAASIYCLQPLVVKQRNKSSKSNALWEVIDGQQRLTTIHILLNTLGKPDFFSLEYQTRTDSQEFLKSIETSKKEANIDYYHIVQAKVTIEEWLSTNTKPHIGETEQFLDKLLRSVKFIWYETDEPNPITVFTRMNIGKIPLTNAELIKALIMNSLTTIPHERIALQWDRIENALENDEFWYFLNDKDDTPLQTRIDFIFDLIRKHRKLFAFPEVDHKNPDKRYQTFQYFYDYLEAAKHQHEEEVQSTKVIWNKVLEIFYAFDEWYQNTELFHYVGFIIHMTDTSVSDLLVEWLNSSVLLKENFINNYLKPIVRKQLSKTPFDEIYELDENSKPKTESRPLLLMYNLQFIINENKRFQESKFKAGIYRRFPFHLFKEEKWDVEHIDSSTANLLEDEKDLVSYLWTAMTVLRDMGRQVKDTQLIEAINDFLNNTITSKDAQYRQNVFDDLARRIDAEMGTEERLSGINEKNKVWNFALLDRNTNRSYKNAIFPAKRRIIISRSQGLRTDIVRCQKDDDIKSDYTRIGNTKFFVVETSSEQSFVPPCTLNAFLKYHTMSSSNLLAWTKADAEAYEASMKKMLQKANLI